MGGWRNCGTSVAPQGQAQEGSMMNYGLVHAIAKCYDCGWESESKNAMLLAGKHHKRTGHEVHAEWAFCKHWPKGAK